MSIHHRVRLISGFVLIAVSMAAVGITCSKSIPLPGGSLGDGTTCRCDTTVQVELETRFITVSSHFLHDVGINLDATIRFNDDFTEQRSFSPAPAANDPLAVFLGVPGVPTDDALEALPPPPPAPSITFPIALVSTKIDASVLQVLLAAVAVEKNGQILSGPKITLQTNESGFIMLRNEQRTVNELNSTFADALDAIDPRISSVITGPSLEVEPRGAELGRIALNLRPSVGVIFNTLDVNGNRPLVQHPESQTSVSVPDGQTIILGGVLNTVTGERAPSVVPLLGDVPIIGRLIDNRKFVGDNDNLMILITPRIINN
jgi:type II secretory pathway component GspD/PulD (secretin)